MSTHPESPTVAPARAGIRLTVCPDCDHRPAATSAACPAGDAGRPCEQNCPLFLLLARFCDLAERHLPEPPCGYALAARSLYRHAAQARLIPVSGGGRAAADPDGPLGWESEAALAVIAGLTTGTARSAETVDRTD